MGNSSGRHRSNWWTEKTNGVVNWLTVALSVLAVVAIVVSIGAYQQRVQALAATSQSAPASTYLPSETPTAAPTPRVAFLGDSYFNGSPEINKTENFAAQAATGLGWEFQIFGAGGVGYTRGSPVANGARELASNVGSIVEYKPNVVIVEGGLNDYDTDTEGNLQSAATDLYRTLQQRIPNAKIIVIGPFTTWQIGDKMERLTAQVEAAASATGSIFVDPIANNWLTDQSQIYSDQIHLTPDAGTAAYRAAFERDVAPLVTPAS